MSLVSLNPASCVLSGVKKAHHENALVLTFFEPTGKDQTLTAEFNPKLFGKLKSAVEVDLIERPVNKVSTLAQGQKVRLKIPAHGIASVLVRFAGSY
jgi:alpha-mannosidase